MCNNKHFSSTGEALELQRRGGSAAGGEGAAGGGGDGDGDGDPAALAQRKRRSVQAYLEQQLSDGAGSGGGGGGGRDPDRVTLAVLLQAHGVVVRGGQPEAMKLMDALAAWKRGEWQPSE